MRILITADLHYDITRSQEPARQLAADICRRGGDALVLLGDSAGADLRPLRQCLALFESFNGVKLLVPGNHCLWCTGGENSVERYEQTLPQVAREGGFEVLDHSPKILVGEHGPVGLVGSIGWYDYAFAEAELGIPEAFYEAKVAPGAAAYYEEYHHLIESHGGQLTPRQLSMSSRWMDGTHVRLGMSDAQFVDVLVRRLRAQLQDLAPRVERIVAFLHHLPFDELVPRGRPDKFAFAAAYMGSPRLGHELLACPKVTHVYCGHSHWMAEHIIGHLTVINIGSTYVQKQMRVLEC